MRLRATLAAIGSRPASIPSRPNRTATEIAASKVRPSDGPPTLDGADLNAKAAEIMVALWTGSPLGARDLRALPWCLWNAQPAIAEDEEAMRAAVAAIEAARTDRPLRSLAAAYIDRPNQSKHGMEQAREALKRQLTRLGSNWQELDRRFDIFHPVNGPRQIGKEVVARKESVEDVLAEAGIGSADPRSGFAALCLGYALAWTAERKDGDHAGRIAHVRTLALDAKGEVKARDYADWLARALIKPFGDAIPDPSVFEDYQNLLLDLFKDPRLPNHGWQRMQPEADVFKRWLTRANIRQFLQVTRIVAKDMFRYREKFWMALYEAGLIEESWVVFAKKGEALARSSFGNSLPFATFKKGGRKSSDQAVLLLKMGDTVIAEWSHDGKVVIWTDQEDRGCPKLYQPTYYDDDLRDYGASDDPRTHRTFSRSHSAPEHYAWQMAVAERLKHIKGIDIPPALYRL